MTYDWRVDALACYHEALRWLAMRAGSRRPQTVAEFYEAEANGWIP